MGYLKFGPHQDKMPIGLISFSVAKFHDLVLDKLASMLEEIKTHVGMLMI